MNQEVDQVTQAVAKFDAVAAGIGALSDRFKDVVFDVATRKGMDDAKAARLAIREPRYEVENLRKAAKAPILELGRTLDARAKSITAQLEALEQPIDSQIKQEEGRAAAEREAKIVAEVARVEGLRAAIEVLRTYGGREIAHQRSAVIGDVWAELIAKETGGDWQEFQQQAADARLARLSELESYKRAAVQREKDAAELAELRKVQAERDAKDLAERERVAALEARQRAEAEAAAKAKEQAERAERERVAAAERESQRIAREKIEAENARLQAERDAALQREAKAKADQERKDRVAASEKRAEEARLAEIARKAAIRRPSDKILLDLVTDHFKADRAKCHEWLLAYGGKS